MPGAIRSKRRKYGGKIYDLVRSDLVSIGEVIRYNPTNWGLRIDRIYWRDGEPNRVSGGMVGPRCYSLAQAVIMMNRIAKELKL